MNVGYEILVYLLNLFLVFTETEFFDILLNALALEFIMEFDNQMKEMYHKANKPTMETASKFMEANGIIMPKLNDMTDDDSRYHHIGEKPKHPSLLQEMHLVLQMSIANWIATFAVIFTYSSLLYLPICKGGGRSVA